MADQIKKLSAGHSIEVLDGIMSEVEEARGEYDSLGERLDEMSSGTPTPSTAAPAMDGTASPGTSEEYARADHVHPSDTSKASATSEAEDRAALVELVDGGAKNIAIPNHITGEPSGITVVQDDKGHFEISGTTGSSQMTLNLFNQPSTIDLPYGAHISAANSISGISYKARWYNPGGEEKYTTIDSTGLELPAGSKLRLLYVQANANTQVSFTIDQMVCTKAAWNISQTYQPYRPSYQELYEMVKALQPAT